MNMAIYSGFTQWKWWFSIVVLVYQRVTRSLGRFYNWKLWFEISKRIWLWVIDKGIDSFYHITWVWTGGYTMNSGCYDINTGAWHCIAKTEHWGFMPAFVFAIMNRYTSGNRHLFGKSISLRCRSFADDGLSIARFVYCRNLLEIEWITSRLECICKAVLSNLFMKVKLEIPVESFSDVNIWVLICEM